MNTNERQFDILRMISLAINAEEVQEAFRSAPHFERLKVLEALDVVHPSFRDINTKLKKKEQRRVAEYLGIEGLKPDEAIAKLFMSGKFLVLPPEEQLKSNLLPQATKSLLLQYAENIKDYGENALAHLCLPGSYFRVLTWQVSLTIDGQRHPVAIRKITQLRTALNQLKGDSADNSMVDNFGRKINTHVLMDKLTRWDAISEELSPREPQ